MTTIPMTCAHFADALAPYLERELDEATSAALEAHAARCADCGSLLADLAALRSEAARLPDLEPSRDLWQGIESRIAPRVVSIADRQTTRDAARPLAHRRWLRLTAAAAALVFITAGVTYSTTRAMLQPGVTARVANSANVNDAPARVASTDSSLNAERSTLTATAPTAPTPTVQRATPNAATPNSPLPTPRSRFAADRRAAGEEHAVEQAYGVEIARLHALVDQRRSRLDSSTVAIIERNLAIIDAAIAESRAALARDPASSFLIQQLNSALDRKVELLRTAATLPSRT